ncbi:ATP-dependent DNA helicase [Shewanella waksmanii]|uniref:ATP-dependent DNA helicase n=1 Tax=Shewanella waksmanii TaxID=213783 RepID=UPI00048C7813|nr:ATP-dependent DNA helicase [Shewanella waksmanii]
MTTRLTKEVHRVFADNGVIATQVKDYSPRPQQVEMAVSVSEHLVSKKTLVVEAGTGVGKTYAYLIPALLSGQQVIVSTGSKNLQEQLFYKDLPALLDMLDIDPKIALLKGRNNYLCQHHMAEQVQGATSMDSQVLDDLLRINHWAGQSLDGDIGGLTSVSEQSPALPYVVSSKDNCLGKRCEYYDDCFTRKARVRAMDAKIIVVNHHLFFADRILKETGFAELLPDSDAVIFDEAHLLPDIAVTYFGQQLNLGTLAKALAQMEKLYRQQLADSPQIGILSSRCLTLLLEWQDKLYDSAQHDWRQLIGNKQLMQAAWQLLEELTALAKVLLGYVGRLEQLDDIIEKWQGLVDKLNVYFQCDNSNAAYSIDFSDGYATLRISPIDVAKECRELFNDKVSWIFTSATLQIDRDLSLFQQALGLKNCRSLLLDSPFDYPKQALFCVPRHLGRVSQQAHAANQLVEVAIAAINAAQGRTFILFTSHSMMNRVAQLLNGRVNYPLLVQGQASKQVLLKKYRQLGNGVLLGTGAFWEGVDVRGKLLSCVIIDKLPFMSPDDNLYKARAEGVSRKGKDPFNELSLPQAVISLNQGVGRLIRDEKDRGVLILCDNRIVNRPYGQAFLNSLPPMSRTRNLDKALTFLKTIS